MWLQWIWWQASCEREFLTQTGNMPFLVWYSLQKKEKWEKNLLTK